MPSANAGWCVDGLAVGSIMLSNHPGNSNHNEKHSPSLYAKCNNWVLGYYRNSWDGVYNNPVHLDSWIGGYEFNINKRGPVALSVLLGAASGYPDEYHTFHEQHYAIVIKKKWVPWGSFNITLYETVKLMVVPGTVAVVALEYNFW